MPLLDTWRGTAIPEAVKAFIGWGGLTVHDETVDVLDMLRAYMAVAAGESCGQCYPCRSGLKRMASRLEAMCAGEEQPNDVEYLRELAQLAYAGSRCDIGQTAPQALLDVIQNAPHLLKAKKVTPGTYTSVVSAPCISACPSHVNIPAYIEKIRFRQFSQGLSCVMEDCPMPGTIGRVCERPCEAACKRGRNGEPVAIRHLKRFLADSPAHYQGIHSSTKPVRSERKIAIVGAGPAGLSCAYYLAHLGIQSTIFECYEEAGGMAKYGIPDYRLPPSVLRREVAIVEALGCEIHKGIMIGKDKTVDDLKNEGFSAIFMGTGASDAPGMHCEGGNDCSIGYISGVYYLHEATKGNRAVTGKRLVIVGGGNVAIDCARTGLRMGFADVQVLYRRTEQEMPADVLEIKEAREEGVIFNFLAAPLRILHEEGVLSGIICQKMTLGEPDASGRRSPVPLEGETFELSCDALIHAIGQKVAVDRALKGRQGGLNKYKTLDAHSITGKVDDFNDIYGGGDCVTGPEALIGALAAGKRAAYHIAEQLGGGEVTATPVEELETLLMGMDMMQPDEQDPQTDYTEAMTIKTIPIAERLAGFTEVELGATEWEATQEASRCLRCYRIAMVAE